MGISSYAQKNHLSGTSACIVSGKANFEDRREISLFCVKNGVLASYANTSLSSNGEFGFVVYPESDGFYYVGDKESWSRIYLKKESCVELQCQDGFYEVVGNVSSENQLLNKWNQLFQEVRTQRDKSVPYGEFFIRFDSIQHRIHSVICPSDLFHSQFERIVECDLAYAMIRYVSRYQQYYVSEEQNSRFYQKLMESFFLDSETLIRMPYALDLISSYFNYKSSFPLRGVDYSFDDQLKELSDDRLRAEYAIYSIALIADYEAYCDFEHRYCRLMQNDDQLRRFTQSPKRPQCKWTPSERVPNFIATDVNGKIVSLSDFKGRLIYIDFWATWCNPCKKEIPHLQALEKQFSDKDIVFISISLDENRGKWQKYLSEHTMSGIQLWLGDMDNVPAELNMWSIPRFVLVDRNGKLLNGNAPRPSNDTIVGELKRFLNK